MPRGARLDAPNSLHSVTVRGIERRTIFRDDRDRQRFLDRLQGAAGDTGLAVLAWALMPNHAHLLALTPSRPGPGSRRVLVTAMRRLLTGYAGDFNRRHRRSGHLFQNRYKSVLVESEAYLLELVRYIHLNPLRAGLVGSLRELDAYPWTGHSAIVGTRPRPWQAVNEVLGQFGGRRGIARQRYREFIATRLAQGRRPELQGGGLRRSSAGWKEVPALRRGREAWAADERILGSSTFVEAVRAEASREPAPWPRAQAEAVLPSLLAHVAALWKLSPSAITGVSRKPPIPAARAMVCAVAVNWLALPAATVARALAISRPAVLQAIARGEELLAARARDLAHLRRILAEDLR